MEGRVCFAELLVTKRTITERPLRTARMDPVLELHRRERKGKTVGRKVAKVAIKAVGVALAPGRPLIADMVPELHLQLRLSRQ